jgi:hypothetical protein
VVLYAAIEAGLTRGTRDSGRSSTAPTDRGPAIGVPS